MPLPGYPPNTPMRRLAWEHYGVEMCASHVDCPKKFGRNAHWQGRVDRAGMIHWRKADTRSTRRGVRHLYKLLALVHHREWWTLPRWKKLHLTNVWAFKEVQRTLHIRVRKEWSYQDRKQAYLWVMRSRTKPSSLRHKDRRFYKWLWDVGVIGGRNPSKRVEYVQMEVTTPPG